MTTWRQEAKDEARRIMEDAHHSYMGHFNASNLWQKVHYWVGVPATALAAVGGSQIVHGSPNSAWGWVAVLGAAFAGLLTFLDSKDHANTHHRAGAAFKSLHDNLRRFVNLELERLDHAEAVKRLRTFQERRDELNTDSRPICRWSYYMAKLSIWRGQSTHTVDRDQKATSR